MNKEVPFPLELHFGKKGVSASMLSQNSECYSGSICRPRRPVGMGGVDMSLGTIGQSLAGLEAWKVNLEILTSGQEEGWKYASALRTLYSVGGVAEKALYEELLSGKTNIAERWDGEYSAKTEANGDGTKTIYIGREALEKGSRFGLNVLLAHEAYRNGIDDGEAGQREETDRAVLGHIGAAYALGQAYGMGVIGEALGKEVATYLAALSTGNMEDLARLLASYDASGDYWRLIRRDDGTYGVQYDGNHSLLDENGNILIRSQLDIISEAGVITGHKETSKNSYARSLGMLMGIFPDYTNDYAGYTQFYQSNPGAVCTNMTNYLISMMENAGYTWANNMWNNPQDGATIDANAYLMTYKDIKRGIGVTRKQTGKESAIISIALKNERDEVVTTVSSSFTGCTTPINLIMIENMIPEGRRLKAATFKINFNGNVEMFGLGSTMPDPSQMGSEYPALADGTYPYAWSLHRPRALP